MTTPRLLAGRYLLVDAAAELGRPAEWRVHDEWIDGREVVATAVPMPAMDEAVARRARQVIADDVRLVGGLGHESVAATLDVVLDDGELWVVREPGPPYALPERAAQAQPVTLVGYGRDVAAGLAAAHRAGVTHRDVRAGAIRVGDDGRAVLAGFATSLLAAGVACPCPPTHRAPELIDGSQPSAAADVYALGMTLRGAIGGRLDALPPDLVELLDAMSAADPGHRPDAAEVHTRLAQLAESMARADDDAPPGGAALSDESAPSAGPLVGGVAGEQRTTRISPPAPSRLGSDEPTRSVWARTVASPPPSDRPWPPAGFPSPGTPPPPLSPAQPAGQPPGPPPPGTAKPPTRRGRVGRRRLVLAVVAMVVVLAGAGTALILTWPAAAPPQASAPPAASAVAPQPFGDPSRADPCSLLDAASLAPYGQAQLSHDLGIAGGCSAEIKTVGGQAIVQAAFGNPTPYLPSGPAERTGELTVYRPQPTAPAGACDRTIVLADGSRVYVMAFGVTGPPPDMCAMADIATGTAVTTITAKRITQRTKLDPPEALTSLDLCTLLDEAQLSRIPGLNSSRRHQGFAGWSCSWGTDPAFRAAPWVVTSVYRYFQLGGQPTNIAGRSAQLIPSKDDATCGLRVVQRVFAGDTGGERVEVLELKVYLGPGQSADAACRTGTELVSAIVPKLPPASP